MDVGKKESLHLLIPWENFLDETLGFTLRTASSMFKYLGSGGRQVAMRLLDFYLAFSRSCRMLMQLAMSVCPAKKTNLSLISCRWLGKVWQLSVNESHGYSSQESSPVGSLCSWQGLYALPHPFPSYLEWGYVCWNSSICDISMR